MKNEEKIVSLLKAIIDDNRQILELQKYNIEEIIEFGLKHELYNSLMLIFKPITIDGVIKIYFDAFSTDLLQKLKAAYDTKEQAELESREEYAENLKRNKEMSLENKEFYGEDKRTYEEILATKRIIPREIKEAFFKSLFTIDFDTIAKMKVKNSHAREISGVNNPINSLQDVIIYSEPACLKTCIDLYNKNILTTMNDTEGVIEDNFSDGICKVHCNYQALTPENKAIVEELIAEGQAEMLSENKEFAIFVPCHGEETTGEVSNRLQKVASRFSPQDVLGETLEEIYQRYLPLIESFPFYAEGCFDDQVTAEGIIKVGKNLGYNIVYDENEGLFWNSEEQYRKHKVYLALIANKKSTAGNLK